MPKRFLTILILLAAISLSRKSFAEESIPTVAPVLLRSLDCDVYITGSGRFVEEGDDDFHRSRYCGRGGLKEQLITKLGQFEAECQRDRISLKADLSLTIKLVSELRLDLKEAKKTVKSEQDYGKELKEQERKLKLKYFGIGGGTGFGVALVVFIVLLIAL